MKKIVILEDNRLIQVQLANLVHELGNHVVYLFDNIKDAYQCAIEKTIDLFLVDIILDTSINGDSSGLRFVENIRKIRHYQFIPVIFVTSLEDARLYAYEKLHCYSFMEKPFDVERMKQVIAQCMHFAESQKQNKTLYFRKEGIILAAERTDIVYVESVNHMLHIHTKQGEVLSIPYHTLKQVFEELDSREFVQCSRNTVINKNYVQHIDFSNRMLLFVNGLGSVEIGVRFRKEVREFFSDK